MTTRYRDDIKRAVFKLAANDIMAEERRPNVWEVDGHREPLTEVQVIAISERLE